ncbi:unnamed protein product [Rotaria socialis]|uniref:Costars domain-containing protein n=1 Tax=Rotaria socialis TaxID=392032 RepID=A0A820LT43_9BILA|nr:unnamed protein product [Rotaria socialis]CAF4362147.1 unnamed protein product [Rotaria socialis]CAF4460382.1 unnamed protein product [Rotaria socialis]
MNTDKTFARHPRDKINHLTNRVNKFQEIVNTIGAPSSSSRAESIYGPYEKIHRGQKVREKILEEMKQLCHAIQTNGTEGDDGTVTITFTDLFEIYTNISDKLVGVLFKARKQGYLTFKGEMLLRNRDENAPIQLIRSSS